MRDRLTDIVRHEHLEAEQERSTDADLVDVGVLLRYRLPQLAISRPYDTDHNDENAEDFDPAPDDADGVIDRRFEALDGVLHLRASDYSRRAAYHHDRLRQLFRSRARPGRYCHRGTDDGPSYVQIWQSAPKARITSGGRFHSESCRLIR